MGHTAERLVEAHVRAALPDGARLYANVPIAAKTRPTGPAHDAEADLVLLDPEQGLLVIETKSGRPSRDGRGRWHIDGHELTRSPFEQAAANKHDLVRAIEGLPGWTAGLDLRAGHAVAFPDVDLRSLPPGHALLGPDAPPDIVLHCDALAAPEATAAAIRRAYTYWVGDGSRGRALTPQELALADSYLAPTCELRRLVCHDVEDAGSWLVQATRSQLLVLNQNRRKRRAEVVGPAGSGKSLIAVEKARRLAREGYGTLFVCYNQPLATAVMRAVEVAEDAPDRRPTVTTFHRLCENLAATAGVLPARPTPIPQSWWDVDLPRALDAAIAALDEPRFHAIVVDEGQDFEPEWFLSLQLLLRDPDDGVFWVFHDPGQALYREDRVSELGLEPLELFEDYRSPARVAEVAAGFYKGPTAPVSMSTVDGASIEVVEAEAGRPTVNAVRRALHRLIEVEGVRPWDIAVLSGGSATHSAVWRQRRFGNVELWCGAIDDDGRSKGLPADEVPDEPADDAVVLFETVRRFKGLERPVVILCELPADGDRLDQLLYTAFTRATAHLVVVAPTALAARLVGTPAAPSVRRLTPEVSQPLGIVGTG